MINFTNPAGLITQAVSHNIECSRDRHLRYPDRTLPSHRAGSRRSARRMCIATMSGSIIWAGFERVLLRGEDVTARMLEAMKLLRSLYQAKLFDFDLLRSLRLIPTEYLFFYYSRRRALANQLAAGAHAGRRDRASSTKSSSGSSHR